MTCGCQGNYEFMRKGVAAHVWTVLYADLAFDLGDQAITDG